MALIKCPECGKENVSDSAVMCPNCGYSLKKAKNKKIGRVVGIIIISLLVICVILGVIARKESEKRAHYVWKATSSINNIVDSLEVIDGYMDDEIVYLSISSDVAIEYTTTHLDYISTYVEEVQQYYGLYDTAVCREIDQYVNENTRYDSWHDMCSDLFSNYFIEETNAESADALIKSIAYSSTEEWLQNNK